MEAHWQIVLIVQDRHNLKQVTQSSSLRGIIREDEKVAVLFPQEIAPSELPAVRCRLVRHGRKWLIEGRAFGTPVPVMIHELTEVHARTPFKPAHQATLQRSTVGMMGLGSIGSPMADFLARAGIGTVILADLSRFGIENVSRHVGTLLDVGRYKTDLVAEQVASINPSMRIVSHAEDIFSWPDKRIAAELKHASLLIASTDVRAVQLMTQDWARRLGIPAVFAGCYEEARGGEVFCYVPEWDGACYGCLRGGLERPQSNPAIAYSTVGNAEDYTGEPGMYASVAQVASIATQLAISLLLRNEPDSQLGQLLRADRQFLLVGTALSEGFYRFRRPFDVYFQPLSGRRSDCAICGTAPLETAIGEGALG